MPSPPGPHHLPTSLHRAEPPRARSLSLSLSLSLSVPIGCGQSLEIRSFKDMWKILLLQFLSILPVVVTVGALFDYAIFETMPVFFLPWTFVYGFICLLLMFTRFYFKLRVRIRRRGWKRRP